jgi:Raf kinase inhibitor-like YbhB/YbcL family protein
MNQASLKNLGLGDSIMSSHRFSRSRGGVTLLLATLAAFVTAPILAGGAGYLQPERGKSPMLQLTSSAFQPESNIPAQFTCDGRNMSPELSWSAAPAGTKSFALVMHDPDAPIEGGYTHWIVYNIPAAAHHLAENVPNQDRLADGAMQGKNDAGKYGYTGPCPPSGTHRYYFRLYALDVDLDSSAASSKASLEKAIHGHVLATGELLGRYKRSAGKAA